MKRNPFNISPASSTPSSPSISTPDAPSSWMKEGHMRYTRKGTNDPVTTTKGTYAPMITKYEKFLRKKNEGESCFAVDDIVYTKIDMVSKDFTVPVRITHVNEPLRDTNGDCRSYSGKIVVDKIEDEGQRKIVEDFLETMGPDSNSFSSIPHDQITESLEKEEGYISSGGKKTKRRMDRSRKNKRRSKSNKKQRKSRR